MKPMRFRFMMITPLASVATRPIGPIMFDGLLGYAWAIKNGLTKTPSEENAAELKFPELPIRKISPRCYAASAGILPPEAILKPTQFVRHADWAAAAAKHKAPDIAYQVAAGFMQAVQEMHWLTVTPYIDFYAEIEDEAETMDLLSVLWESRHLGSKRGSGFGLIGEILADEMTEKTNYSIWKNGRPTRPLPVEAVGEHPELTKEWAAECAPYWHPANKTWCYMPPVEQYRPARTEETLHNVEIECKNVQRDYQIMMDNIEAAKKRKAEEKKTKGKKG